MRRLVPLVLLCGILHANAGIFSGSGHTVELVKTEEIQLVSEEVTIVPSRARWRFDGGGGMDRVEYYCKFKLRNLTDERVEVQVGFPLDSQFMKQPYDPKEHDEEDLILTYQFMARDKEKTYHVRYAPGDGDLRSIFLWDMAFAPGETRDLAVLYEMPISMGLGTTAIARGEYAKPWYVHAEFALVESFRYVTRTGRSWAGEVEKATFEVALPGFESYVRERGFFEDEESRSRKALPKRPRVFRRIAPSGWREGERSIVWEFEGEVPEGPLAVAFYVTVLPTVPEDVPAFAKAMLGEKPAAEDLSDLKEILLATYGVAPKTPRVLEFVSRQIWYEERAGVELAPAERAIIDALESVR
ncbi:MAG: DUF4424 domain-containing protein [Planctomycetes bacterium]|nr:DUF4424 domain-containing protein [Planctomycetota bacterium]